MASLNGVQTRAILAKGTVVQIEDGTGVAIRLKAMGAAGAVTSVTVTTGTNIVMVTANGGTDTYAFATYTTIGSLVDAINGDGMFEARVLDALRSHPTLSSLTDGAITLSGSGYYDVLNSAASLNLSVCLSPDREVGSNYKLRDGHRVSLQEIVYAITFTAGVEAGAMKIYERTPAFRGNIEKQVLSLTPVDVTATTFNFAGGNGRITASEGNELVVVFSDTTGVAATAGVGVRVTGVIE